MQSEFQTLSVTPTVNKVVVIKYTSCLIFTCNYQLGFAIRCYCFTFPFVKTEFVK